MRGRISRRMLGTTLVLAAVTLAAVGYVLSGYVADQQAAAAQQRLEAMAWLLARDAATLPEPALSQWATAMRSYARARITLLRIDRSVVADSSSDAERARSGPEVADAWRSGSGRAVSPGPKPGSRIATVVMRVERSAAAPLMLQLTAPVEEASPAARGLLLSLMAIVFAFCTVALAVAYVVARALNRRVRHMKRMAEELLEVPTQAGEISDTSDELGALERSLAGVAAQIRTLLDRLRLESARRESILACMAEGVLAVDSDMRIIFCNEAVMQAVGGGRKVQENMRLMELIRDAGLTEMLSDVARTGETRKRRMRITSDKERSFEVQAGPLAMPTGQGVIAILYDMTDLERLEQVRKDFVANVSHELRTPLAGIIGYSETLLDGALEDKKNNRRFLEIIHSNAVRLNSIASDLLVLSELESQIDSPEAGRIAVREVIDSVLATVGTEASSRQVRLIREEIEDVDVMGSRLRLEQAVLNLVANAIKFNQPGGEVRIKAISTADGRVSITVADTGVGIPSQDLPRIFERFYRVDKGRSRQVGGTGLGLTIVKHVIERMNGSIEVQSRLREGSTFTAHLQSAARVE